MKDTFVNNIQELMTANENQRIKIGYLQSEKQKRQQYLSGLKQSISLNKQTLIVLNSEGPNLEAIDHSAKENFHLIKINQNLYHENRQMNALLLMEQQLRVEEKDFYLERINEFENRIGDLRKYLHDKEESFSTVVSRLKKYEEWNEKPLSEKIQDTEGLRKITNQIISKLMSEKNTLKTKYQQILPDAHRYQLLKQTLKNPVNFSRLAQNFSQNQTQTKVFSETHSPRRQLIDFQLKLKNQSIKMAKDATNHNNIKPSQVNKELMRLLKKQKLNNQILESALHNAIQKNEELLKINENLERALNGAEKKIEKIIAQNNFCRLKFKHFNNGYGKKYCQNRIRDQDDEAGFLNLFKLTYEIKDEYDQQVSSKVYKTILKESLKQDVQKLLKIPFSRVKTWEKDQDKLEYEQRLTQMTTNDMTRLRQKLTQGRNLHNQRQNEQNSNQVIDNANRYFQKYNKMMVKSASQPRIVLEWQDVHQEQLHESQQMIVDQF